MTDIFRRRVARRPTLAEYLEAPDDYPTVAGRPYPNVNPMGAVGAPPPDLAALLAEEPDPLGPPLGMPGARDVHVPGVAFGALAMPSAPPEPAPAPAWGPQGIESRFAPQSAEDAPSTDLDAEWAAALQRAQAATYRESGYGLRSPAVDAAYRQGLRPRPEPPRPPQPGPMMAALINSPMARYIRNHSDPMFVAPHLREADARYATRVAIPPARRAR